MLLLTHRIDAGVRRMCRNAQTGNSTVNANGHNMNCNQVGFNSHNFQIPLQREMDGRHSLLEAMNDAGLQLEITVARGNIKTNISQLIK